MAVAAACLSLGAGLAAAAGGGGGITPPSPPEISDAVCISTCGGMHKATEASKIQLTGKHLSGVTKVSFKSAVGGRVKADPNSTSKHTVTAKIPTGAATGRPKVSDSFDNDATSPTSIKIVAADQIPSTGDFKLKEMSAKPRRAFYDGTKKPKVKYLFTNSEPTDVRIDVIDTDSHEIVDSFTDRAAEPNTLHKARWDGFKSDTKRPAPNGTYKFRVGPQSGAMESAGSARFQYHRYKFPVRGPHSYGDGVGAPRSGHTHEGQDVMADCGTTLQAARGGRVQYEAYQSAAGNYIVIDGKRTGHDYAYMHLKKPSPLHRGEKVKTGEKIGIVGDTGDATACHLHMEEWSAPGWYEGGNFLKSVTRHLKEWDGWS